MNNAKLSESKQKQEDVFSEMVETVFLFIHEHYGEFGSVIKENDINYTQYVALLTVYMNVTLSEGDLARMMFINPSTVSRMVYSLEERGWLKSERDSTDRRKVLVSLTPEGKRRMGDMRKKQAEVIARGVRGLDEEKKEYVFKVAEFVNQALKHMISGGREVAGEAEK